MKVGVCGKGGAGKSTVVTLLARELVKRGKEVLVVDADESNYGLHRHLGMEKPADFMEYVGGKKAFIGSGKDFLKQYFKGPWKISDIPAGYVSEKDGIRLMSSGKIQECDEGCACPFNAVITAFLGNLVLDENQVLIMDMEAGIEHFGRGIDDHMDMIFMVCDPAYESVQLAKKISDMAAEIGKPVYYILNKVDESNEEIVREAIGQADRIAAVLPANKTLIAEGLKGTQIEVEVPQIKGVADIVCA